MKIQKMLLYATMLLAVSFSAGCDNSSASSQVAPPNLRPGVKFRGESAGSGGLDGVVKEIRGNWVLTESGSWVNFDNVVYYYIQK